MDITKRIKWFYTKAGLVNESALDIGLQQISPLDDLIEKYEQSSIYMPELYKLNIHILEGLYSTMDTQYREFYDEVCNDHNKTLCNRLQQYHHDVVTVITERIKEQRTKHHKAKTRFHVDDTTVMRKVSYDEEEVYKELKQTMGV